MVGKLISIISINVVLREGDGWVWVVGGGVQPRLRPRPIDKNMLVSGINGRKRPIFAVVPIDSWDEFYALYCQNK